MKTYIFNCVKRCVGEINERTFTFVLGGSYLHPVSIDNRQKVFRHLTDISQIRHSWLYTFTFVLGGSYLHPVSIDNRQKVFRRLTDISQIRHSWLYTLHRQDILYSFHRLDIRSYTHFTDRTFYIHFIDQTFVVVHTLQIGHFIIIA